MGLVEHYPCEPVAIFEIGIKRNFIPDPQPDQNSHCHADRESTNVNDGITLVPDQIAPADFEITFEHTPVWFEIPDTLEKIMPKLNIGRTGLITGMTNI